MVCRSDSSAARSLACRIGVGRPRHIASGLLWLQQKVNEKEMRVTVSDRHSNSSQHKRHGRQDSQQGQVERLEVFGVDD